MIVMEIKYSCVVCLGYGSSFLISGRSEILFLFIPEGKWSVVIDMLGTETSRALPSWLRIRMGEKRLRLKLT
jgi:hypothetical protein